MECETISRIGHWRSSQHVNRITVKEWLNTYSYKKHITFYKHRSRPPTATAELFRSPHTISSLETEHQSKNHKLQKGADRNSRESADSADDNAQKATNDTNRKGAWSAHPEHHRCARHLLSLTASG